MSVRVAGLVYIQGVLVIVRAGGGSSGESESGNSESGNSGNGGSL